MTEPNQYKPRGKSSGPCAICGVALRPGEDAICHRCLADSEAKQKKTKERPTGGARTPFGTRVSTAITCAECGKRDHIGFRPKKGARTLCRDCAAKLLGRYESGAVPRKEMTSITCAHCGRQAELAQDLVEEGQAMLCPDCFNGIYSYQGDRSRTGERRSSGVILSRRGKAAQGEKAVTVASDSAEAEQGATPEMPAKMASEGARTGLGDDDVDS